MYSDSPKLSLGSVARGEVLQSLQYDLGRNHGLKVDHILFQQQLNMANNLARIFAIYHRQGFRGVWEKDYFPVSLEKSPTWSYSEVRACELATLLASQKSFYCKSYAFATANEIAAALEAYCNHSNEM